MAFYTRNWWYPDQAPVANQQAIVFFDNSSAYAPIFSDAGLTIPMANPNSTDAAGHIEFYIADGSYWIWVGPNKTGDSEEFTLPATTGPVSAFNVNVGDGVATVFLINHGLNNPNPMHSIMDNATKQDETADVVHTTANSVTVTFNTPPTLNQFNVALQG